jgi:hypothetical protein
MSDQDEQAKREGRVARPMNLISFVTALQPFVDEFMGRLAASAGRADLGLCGDA